MSGNNQSFVFAIVRFCARAHAICNRSFFNRSFLPSSVRAYMRDFQSFVFSDRSFFSACVRDIWPSLESSTEKGGG